MKMNFGVRTGFRMQNPRAPNKLDDIGLDTIYVEPRFSGEINEWFAWTANFNAGVLPGAGISPTGSAGIMDLIGQFNLHDAFHLWAGRLLVPSDRSNFSGPFFMAPWNYPGLYIAGPPVGPLNGPAGRDNGAVVWGQFVGGKAKYYVGAFGLNAPATHPYYSARVNLCILGEEPGFYHSSTYYGGKDILAIGGAIQYRKDVSIDQTGGLGAMTNLMADLLFEKNLGAGGVVDFEAQYYHFKNLFLIAPKQDVAAMPTAVPPVAAVAGNAGTASPTTAFYLLASWMTPSKIGIGKLQPLLRLQRTADPAWTIIDAAVAYVIADYDLRIHLGYQRTDLGSGSTAGNAIQLGIQLQR
jgi:hypothetical protein